MPMPVATFFYNAIKNIQVLALEFSCAHSGPYDNNWRSVDTSFRGKSKLGKYGENDNMVVSNRHRNNALRLANN